MLLPFWLLLLVLTDLAFALAAVVSIEAYIFVVVTAVVAGAVSDDFAMALVAVAIVTLLWFLLT